MSGLLNTQRACRRAQSRSSSGVSPSKAARPHVREVELGEGPQLVGGQRLGRREVEGGGPRVGGERGEHRQLVGQRLAGRGAGRHHDVPPGVGQLGGLHLVGPRARARRGRPACRGSARAPRPATARSRPARAGTRTTWRSGDSSSRPPRAAVGERASPASGAARPAAPSALGELSPRSGDPPGARSSATTPSGATPEPASTRAAGRSRAPARIRLPRPRPPSSRPPTVAHEPPASSAAPSVRPDPTTTRGMSQRCHERPSNARRPGQPTCPVRDATVTGPGGRVPPEQPRAVAHLHCVTPSPLLPAARGCSASDARDAVSSALVDLIHRTRRTDGCPPSLAAGLELAGGDRIRRRCRRGGRPGRPGHRLRPAPGGARRGRGHPEDAGDRPRRSRRAPPPT